MWTIKQMAQATGISADSLRYYDKSGIVSPKRAENGYRYYDETDYLHLQYLMVLKYAHFSLSEIKVVITSMTSDALEACDECNRSNLAIFARKRKELLEMAHNYQSIARLIDNLLPMMNGSEAYLENEQQIKAYVQGIYEQINTRTAVNGVADGGMAP